MNPSRLAVIACATVLSTVGMFIGSTAGTAIGTAIGNKMYPREQKVIEKVDNLECTYSDYTRVGRTTLELYEGTFTVSRETLKNTKYGDILEGRRVLQNNALVSVPQFTLYMEDEKALGGLLIVRCK